MEKDVVYVTFSLIGRNLVAQPETENSPEP